VPIGANWAIYALTAVEMRFGLVLLVFFRSPAMPQSAVASESATAKAATSTYLVAYIVAALSPGNRATGADP
jgi:hypothetical protein